MTSDQERDYVLGTNEEELARLGLQHRVWRDVVLACWREAGIGEGKRVLDIGAGPGYATFDLAALVGSNGRVTAVERSRNFISAMRRKLSERAVTNVDVQEIDLMTDPLPDGKYDFSWCRWVLCFVNDPAVIIQKLAAVMRRGSRAIFHEYGVYRTWRFLPPQPQHQKFVDIVVESWRASGGEPDVGLELPKLLGQHGFRAITVRPHIFAIRPSDPMWQWPATFIESGSARLQELGAINRESAQALQKEFATASASPGALMLTPLVIEIVAEKE